MFKKIIPVKYQFDLNNLYDIINDLIGEKVYISFGSDRILKVNYDFTSEELTTLKSQFLNICEVVGEL